MNYIYEIVEGGRKGKRASRVYAWVILITIVASLMPMAFKEHYVFFHYIEVAASVIFLIDYFLRWMIAPCKLKKGKKSFFLHPFTFWAIIDLMAILPSIHLVGKSFKLFKSIKFLKIMEAFKTARIFKALRYVEHFSLIRKTIKKEWHAIAATLLMLFVYVLSVALIMFNIEMDAFHNFFDALYWSITALYANGDLVSETGRIISIISSIMLVAVIAEITVIVTIGFLREYGKRDVK